MAPLLMIAAAASAFNLSCDVERHTMQMVGPVTAPTRVTLTYRIDLAMGRWCEGECRETSSIAVLDDQHIVLTNIGSKTAAFDRLIINRESGSFEWATGYVGAWSRVDKGFCTRATFTGFPTQKF